ncbi:MAG TPA: LamG domain-containing protein [Terriglobales bacterium]|nr:LamG domain-containing protein [Terriglobales bacterium]
MSILSQRLPEPTSYSGKNIIAFDFKDTIFRERPNEAQLLEFDGTSTHVDCGNPAHLQGGTSSSLTIEAWIRADNRGTQYQHIVSHGQQDDKERRAEVFLRIDNNFFQFGTWNGKNVAGVGSKETTEVRSADLKTWVHLAGVYDHTDTTYRFYRNGIHLDSVKSDLPPQPANAPWYIGAMWHVSENKMVRHFKGFIAEVRIWRVARTEEEIRRYMFDSLPPSGVGQLGAYWRLRDGSGSNVADSSGCDCDGTARGTVNWKWTTSPVGELSRLLQRQPKEQAKKAFDMAKASGFFDPLVFPRIRGVMDQPERRRAREAIRDLEFETFNAFYESGHHLILRRNFFGATEYAFVQNPPPTVKPQLMLVEEYRLSSFLGSYGVGRTLKTFSLLPGEKTKLTIRTASRSTTAAKQSQSILDSYSQESASDFETSLNEEKTDRFSTSSEVSAKVSVEASGSWGFGKASASASMEGSSNSAREQFAKSVSNATAKHAAKASANRNVQIDTTTETTVTEEKETEIVREIENINVGRTLNFVFCQMNQEVISLLHLIDVRIGYTNGIEPLREAALYELPDLLERVVIDDARERKNVQQRIENEIKKIRNYRGLEVENFVLPVKDGGGDGRCTINRDFASEFIEPATKTPARVPGIIISFQSIVMRTEDVAVDSLVGQGSALDLYSEKLQDEENRRKKLANDTAEVQNRLMESDLKRNEAMLALVQKKDVDLLKAFAEALRLSTVGNPTRVVSVWENGSASAKTDGQSQPKP